MAPLLTALGHRLFTVTNPMTSLEDDVANTAAVLEETTGPVLLAGHSYGGAVISQVGRDPRVRGLVYIAAFGPAEGETVNEIVERYEEAEISKYMRRGPNGEWKSEPSEEFWAEIGPDLSAEQRVIVEAEGRKAENLIFTRSRRHPRLAHAAELVHGRRRRPDAAPGDPERHGGPDEGDRRARAGQPLHDAGVAAARRRPDPHSSRRSGHRLMTPASVLEVRDLRVRFDVPGGALRPWTEWI